VLSTNKLLTMQTMYAPCPVVINQTQYHLNIGQLPDQSGLSYDRLIRREQTISTQKARASWATVFYTLRPYESTSYVRKSPIHALIQRDLSKLDRTAILLD
jgi:hypothetical protein